MRSAQPKTLACLLLAMLILVGTSGQALASLFCSTEACPKQAVKSESKPKSCCPESTEEEEKGTPQCCCKIEAAPDIAVKPSAVVIPSTPVDVVWSPVDFSSLKASILWISKEIPVGSDLSPPSPPLARDSGRSPPVA